MRVLVDTQVFLWGTADDPRLSKRAREILADGGNELFLSAVTGWEIAIKAMLGKLKLPDTPRRFVLDRMALLDLRELPIEMRHVLQVENLPFYHRDPFDRLLIAQSQVEGLSILGGDAVFPRYGVEVIW